jgi:Xaa-Pro aminopeptidase
MKNIFAENRKRFAKKLPNGGMLILFAGEPPVMRGDEFYPFAPSRNFYYLTGIDRPGLIFTMRKVKGALTETIYLKRFDEAEAKWVGAELAEDEARNISAVENFGFADRFEDAAAALIGGGTVKSVFLDLENASFSACPTAGVAFAVRLKASFPAVNVADAYPVFGGLRARKSPEEIKNMRRAVGVTGEAFDAILKNARPGMREYEIEAYIDYVFKKNGCGHAFRSIVAGGKNAAVLHYTDNNAVIDGGALALIDFGAQYNWYSADVTRTIPINGVFTPRQRQIYDIVLGGNKLIIDCVKPGETLKNLNEKLKSYYVKELLKIGLITSKSQLGDYYYHGVSHPLGLETHDAGRGVGFPEELEAGMVITVEPGLYIEREMIGVRIEDDVLVTEKGREVLTDSIPKEAGEIERLMAR